MRLNKKIILTSLALILIIVLSASLTAALIPVDTKSIRECGEIKKTRYSIILGEEDEFNSIEKYTEGDLYGGICFQLNYDEINLYIL